MGKGLFGRKSKGIEQAWTNRSTKPLISPRQSTSPCKTARWNATEGMRLVGTRNKPKTAVKPSQNCCLNVFEEFWRLKRRLKNEVTTFRPCFFGAFLDDNIWIVWIMVMLHVISLVFLCFSSCDWPNLHSPQQAQIIFEYNLAEVHRHVFDGPTNLKTKVCTCTHTPNQTSHTQKQTNKQTPRIFCLVFLTWPATPHCLSKRRPRRPPRLEARSPPQRRSPWAELVGIAPAHRDRCNAGRFGQAVEPTAGECFLGLKILVVSKYQGPSLTKLLCRCWKGFYFLKANSDDPNSS